MTVKTPEEIKAEEIANQSSQSPEQKKFLDDLMAKTAANKVIEEKTKTRNEFLKATKDSIGEEVWAKLAEVKVNDKNIDEMLIANPEILDNPSMFTHTLETFKTVGLSQKPASDTAGDTGQDTGSDAAPGAVGGGSSSGEGYKVPALGSADFFKDLQEGKLTREAVNSSALTDAEKLNILFLLPRTPIVKVDNTDIQSKFGVSRDR